MRMAAAAAKKVKQKSPDVTLLLRLIDSVCLCAGWDVVLCDGSAWMPGRFDAAAFCGRDDALRDAMCYDLRLTKHLLDSEFAHVTITQRFDRDRGNQIRYWRRLHRATVGKYNQNTEAGMHAKSVALCSCAPTAPRCSPHYICCAQLRLPHVMLLVVPEGFSAAAAALQVGFGWLGWLGWVGWVGGETAPRVRSCARVFVCIEAQDVEVTRLQASEEEASGLSRGIYF
jgi:hypothetical protein